MAFQLSFQSRHKYSTRDSGLTVRTILSNGMQLVHCVASVDTGASVCLFQRELADILHLDLESGHLIRLSTLVGPLLAFGHEIVLQTFDLAFQTTVYFSANYGQERNLLGRFGWLQQVRLGIIDYDEDLYLGAYNDRA
ncbi:MAG: hypothetical protein ACRD4L_08995 [Pyrinomonadaceae bacterium]